MEKSIRKDLLCLIALCGLSACADSGPSGSGARQADDNTPPLHEQELNLLSLAGSDTASLTTPWDARDRDVLAAAANRTPSAAGSLARLLTETRTPCSGGGEQLRTVDNQDPPWYSAGDTYTTQYLDCVEGTTLLSGTRIYSVDAMGGQPYVTPQWDTTTTMSRQDFVRSNTVTGDTQTANGSLTTALAATQLDTSPGWFAYEQVTTGNYAREWNNNGAVQSSEGNSRVTLRWEDTPASQFEWEFDVTVSSTQFGSSQARTLSVLTGMNWQPPESGQLEIIRTDVEGVVSNSLVTATGSGSVLVETDVDNDGVIDITQSMSWSQLMLESIIYQTF